MESPHFKNYLLMGLLITLHNGITSVSSVETNTAEAENKTSKVLPLILIRTSNALQLPSVVSLQSVFLFWEKVKFNVSPGEEQFYFCEIETNAQRNKILEARAKAKEVTAPEVVDSKCLFEKTYNLEILKTHLPTCIHEPEPKIMKIYEKNNDSGVFGGFSDENELKHLRCGPQKKGSYYRFGYRIWVNKGFLEKVSRLDSSITNAEAYPFRGVIDFEIYRFCYDETSKKVLHTEHKILSPALLFFDKLKKENEKTYEMSTHTFDEDDFNFENLKNAYEELNHLDEAVIRLPDQKTQKLLVIPPRKNFKIQKLVPPNDFPFALWRKPTFHYANTKLMHVDLLPLWDHIAEVIEQKAKRDNSKFDIYTGTFDVSNIDRSDPLFNNHLDSVEIWVKILHLSFSSSETAQETRSAVAIIIINYLTGTWTDYLSEYCTTNHCTNFAEDKYFVASKYVVCCEVTDAIKRLFEIELIADELLEIEGFIRK